MMSCVLTMNYSPPKPFLFQYLPEWNVRTCDKCRFVSIFPFFNFDFVPHMFASAVGLVFLLKKLSLFPALSFIIVTISVF